MFLWQTGSAYFLMNRSKPYVSYRTSCTYFFSKLLQLYCLQSSLYIEYSTANFRFVVCWPFDSSMAVSVLEYIYIYIYIYIRVCVCGPGGPVGIATDYGLEGPGSNPGGDEIFRPSRPDLGLTQPPVKWAPGLSRE